MSRRRRGCTVHVNHHQRLYFRIYFDGREWKEGTGLRDNKENRIRVERAAERIARAINEGTFSYLRFFPRGNRAAEFQPTLARPPVDPPGTRPTVASFFEATWLRTLAVPKVRRETAKQYASGIRRHVLPTLGDVALDALTWRDLANLQADLQAAGVGAPAVNRALHHALRSMLRDARRISSFVPSVADLYDRSLWQRLPEDPDSDPDPYDEQERDLILEHFRTSLGHWYPFVVFQFFQGTRPSEAIALRRVDVDLRYGTVRIRRSRVGTDEGKTKNVRSKREIRLHQPTLRVLTSAWPVHAAPTDFVFATPAGKPILEQNFYRRIWLPTLRRLKIRERPFYNCRHSYVSFMLSIGKRLAFVSEQTGHSIRTLEKHYKKYLPQDDDLKLPIDEAIGTPSRPRAPSDATRRSA